MPDTAITNEKLFPSYNDVNGGVAGDGMRFTEANVTKITNAIIGQNYVLSGFVIPASSADLNLAIPSGEAMLDGRYINVPGSTTLAMTASTTNYIFLKVNKDGNGRVTDAEYEVNTTGTPPADSVLIGTAVTSGSAVTSTVDRRIFGCITVAKLAGYETGTNVIASSDAEVLESGGTYVKVKEIQVARYGNFNAYVELSGSAGGTDSTAFFRRNGTEIGVQMQQTGTTYVSFNQDFGGWVPGDLFQLYLKNISGLDARARNFRMRVANGNSNLYRAEIVNI